MNRIKFEFFKNVAEVSEESFDGSDELSLCFAGAGDGYLSVGPRIIRVEGGQAKLNLGSLSEGIHGCYLMLDGERYELPGLEKTQRQIRTVAIAVRAQRARVKYLKDLEARLIALEADMARANEKIFGKKGII